MDATTMRCPRCNGPVPNAEHVGEYPGAVSRTDNATEICSACGLEEALEGMLRGGPNLGAQETWPIISARAFEGLQKP